MPAFVHHQILGLVKDVPPHYEAKKLQAVPAWRLLQDEDFCATIGYDSRKERLDRARALLLRLLEGSEAVTKELADACQLAGGSALADRRARLAETLLQTSLETLFGQALAVQDRRRRAGDLAGAKVAKDLVLALLPAFYDHATVEEVRLGRTAVSPCLLVLPTRLATVAEIIMAGTDRRDARFHSPASRLTLSGEGW
jgi:hypothetical protein